MKSFSISENDISYFVPFICKKAVLILGGRFSHINSGKNPAMLAQPVKVVDWTASLCIIKAPLLKLTA